MNGHALSDAEKGSSGLSDQPSKSKMSGLRSRKAAHTSNGAEDDDTAFETSRPPSTDGLQGDWGTPWSQRSFAYQFMPFRGMYYDVKGRAPYYVNDWVEGFKPKNLYRVAAASIRMYFIKWVCGQLWRCAENPTDTTRPQSSSCYWYASGAAYLSAIPLAELSHVSVSLSPRYEPSHGRRLWYQRGHSGISSGCLGLSDLLGPAFDDCRCHWSDQLVQLYQFRYRHPIRCRLSPVPVLDAHVRAQSCSAASV